MRNMRMLLFPRSIETYKFVCLTKFFFFSACVCLPRQINMLFPLVSAALPADNRPTEHVSPKPGSTFHVLWVGLGFDLPLQEQGLEGRHIG